MRDVVLAAKPLSVGTTVKPADIKLGKIPATAFPKGGFSKPEEVIDRPVISNILMDEAILDGRLAARGSGLGLAPIIPVGMRAVTVRVNDVSGIAGFVLPGMRRGHSGTGQSAGRRWNRDRDSAAEHAGALGRNGDSGRTPRGTRFRPRRLPCWLRPNRPKC